VVFSNRTEVGKVRFLVGNTKMSSLRKRRKNSYMRGVTCVRKCARSPQGLALATEADEGQKSRRFHKALSTVFYPLANPADVAAIRNIDGWIKDSLQRSVNEFID
jgi:hypothetical protein